MNNAFRFVRLMSANLFQNTALTPQSAATVAAMTRAQVGRLSKKVMDEITTSINSKKPDSCHMAAKTNRFTRRLSSTLRAISLLSLFIGFFLSTGMAIIASLVVSGVCLLVWWALKAWEGME